MNQDNALSYTDPLPKWKRWIQQKLFPYKYAEFPELPENFKDGVISNVKIEFSIIDRIRLFISGRAELRIITFTENRVGNTSNPESAFNCSPPKFLS